MSEFDDEHINRLAGRIRKSDRKAFDDLFRIFYPRLVHFSMRYVRQKPAACDVVQDAFVALWQKRSTIDPNQALKSYMYTTVRNRSLNWLQNQANRNESMDANPALRLVSEKPAHADPDSEADEASTLSELFKNWICDLPERQQEAFELSRFDGMSHDEIAEIMNVSPKTVNNHIVAALSMLRSRYEHHRQTEKEG
jgi:RNA polymerase sigma-70 factor, ECF subfamily